MDRYSLFLPTNQRAMALITTNQSEHTQSRNSFISTNQRADIPGSMPSPPIREYMNQELPYHYQPKQRVQCPRTRNSFISIFVFIRWPKYSIFSTNQKAYGPVTSHLYQRTDGPEIPSLPPTNQRANSPRTLSSPPTREQKAQILLISTYQSTRDLCVTCSPLSPKVASMWRNIPVSITFLLSSMLALDGNASQSASRNVPGMWGSTHLQLQFHLSVEPHHPHAHTGKTLVPT